MSFINKCLVLNRICFILFHDLVWKFRKCLLNPPNTFNKPWCTQGSPQLFQGYPRLTVIQAVVNPGCTEVGNSKEVLPCLDLEDLIESALK